MVKLHLGTVERLRQPRTPATDAERETLARVANGLQAIVPPQMMQLSLGEPSRWGARREFVLGYVMGAAAGICEALSIPHLAESAGLAAAERYANSSEGPPVPRVNEIATYVETGREGYAQAYEGGRFDGLAWATKSPAAGLLRVLHAVQAPSPVPSTGAAKVVISAFTGTGLGKMVSAIPRLFARYLGPMLLAGFVLFILWPVYQTWSKKRDIEVQAAERQRAKEATGVDASVTAAMLWNAYKACHVVGLTDVPACSQNSGTLIQESTARALADLALKRKASFDRDCRSHSSADECDGLLQRALAISQNEDRLGR